MSSALSTPAISVQGRCHVCLKWRNQSELIPFAGDAVRCLDCEQAEIEAQARRILEVRKNCDECGTAFRQAEADWPGNSFPITFIFDGQTHKCLCPKCTAKVQMLTRDRYKGTPYGAQLESFTTTEEAMELVLSAAGGVQ